MAAIAVFKWAYRGVCVSDVGFFLFVYPGLLVTFLKDLLPSRQSKLRRDARRESWSRPRPPAIPIERVSLYHESCPVEAKSYTIDDQTWGDLDLDEMFRRVDHTSSAVGQQVLYRLLRSPHDEEEALRALDSLARYMARCAGAREKIQLILEELDANDAAELPRLFSGDLHDPSRLRLLFPLMTGLALGALAAVPLLPGWTLFLPVLALAGNIGAGLYYRRRLADVIPAVRPLRRLIVAGERLNSIDDASLSAVTGPLRHHCSMLRRIKRTCAYLAFENHFNEVAASFYAYLNTFFLADLNAVAVTLHRLDKDREHIHSVYETVGYIDAAMALASFREGLAHYSTPNFSGGKSISRP